MEILIEITKKYEKDLKKLSHIEKDRIKEKINFLIESYRKSGKVKQLDKLHIINLPENLSSSLFIYRIDKNLKTILTIEKDPLFEQSIFTFFRVVKHSDIERAFKSVSDSLYHIFFNLKEKGNGGD